MSDKPFYTLNMKRAPVSVGQAAELLFEFYVERTKKFYRCELRDHGPTYGVEAQFFDPVDLVIARRSIRGSTPRGRRASWRSRGHRAAEGLQRGVDE